MEIIELKFLLKLLEFKDYRTPLSKLNLNPTISEFDREQICQNLCDRGFLVCSYKIKKFKIAPPGKFLLKQDSDELPLTNQERKVLRASAKGKITPKETGIPAEERQTVIQSLLNRGLIEVKSKHKTIQDVWLSERGKEYLQYEYEPSEISTVFSSEVLSIYLQFLRKSFQDVAPLQSTAALVLSDEKILLTIQELERQLTTNNRLPIYHLREKLHPLLSEEELDEALHRLQRQDKIELSAVQPSNTCIFTSESSNAEINGEVGARMFFVTVTAPTPT